MLQHMGRIDLGAAFVRQEGQIVRGADKIGFGSRDRVQDFPALAPLLPADVQLDASHHAVRGNSARPISITATAATTSMLASNSMPSVKLPVACRAQPIR